MKLPFLNALMLFCIATLTLLSCESSPKKGTVHVKRQIEKLALATPDEAAINRVMDLDEVKRKSAEVERLSEGKRHLSAYVETAPTKENPYYWIKVAEDNGDSQVAYYTFAVDSKTRDVRYYDPIQDSLITIEEWRKTTPLNDR